MLSHCLSSLDGWSSRFKTVSRCGPGSPLGILLWLEYGSSYPFPEFVKFLWTLLLPYTCERTSPACVSSGFCCFLISLIPCIFCSGLRHLTSTHPWPDVPSCVSSFAGLTFTWYHLPPTGTKRLEMPLSGTGLPEVLPCAPKLSYIHL